MPKGRFEELPTQLPQNCFDNKLVSELVQFVVDYDTPHIALGTKKVCYGRYSRDYKGDFNDSRCAGCSKDLYVNDIWLYDKFKSISKHTIIAHYSEKAAEKSSRNYIEPGTKYYEEIKAEVFACLKDDLKKQTPLPTQETINRGLQLVKTFDKINPSNDIEDVPF